MNNSLVFILASLTSMNLANAEKICAGGEVEDYRTYSTYYMGVYYEHTHVICVSVLGICYE